MTQRIEQLRKLLQSDPNDAFCLYGLALEHAKLGEHDKAIEHFDLAIAADPNSCYAYFHKAKSLEQQGDIAAARYTLAPGLAKAKAIGDQHAMSEISAYLFELEDA
jgi:tetratricopeptide (TPR) repeat protein